MLSPQRGAPTIFLNHVFHIQAMQS
jgi:hypothetical protein